jgi:hypothetical protein
MDPTITAALVIIVAAIALFTAGAKHRPARGGSGRHVREASFTERFGAAFRKRRGRRTARSLGAGQPVFAATDSGSGGGSCGSGSGGD